MESGVRSLNELEIDEEDSGVVVSGPCTGKDFDSWCTDSGDVKGAESGVMAAMFTGQEVFRHFWPGGATGLLSLPL